MTQPLLDLDEDYLNVPAGVWVLIPWLIVENRLPRIWIGKGFTGAIYDPNVPCLPDGASGRVNAEPKVPFETAVETRVIKTMLPGFVVESGSALICSGGHSNFYSVNATVGISIFQYQPFNKRLVRVSATYAVHTERVR